MQEVVSVAVVSVIGTGRCLCMNCLTVAVAGFAPRNACSDRAAALVEVAAALPSRGRNPIGFPENGRFT